MCASEGSRGRLWSHSLVEGTGVGKGADGAGGGAGAFFAVLGAFFPRSHGKETTAPQIRSIVNCTHIYGFDIRLYTALPVVAGRL